MPDFRPLSEIVLVTPLDFSAGQLLRIENSKVPVFIVELDGSLKCVTLTLDGLAQLTEAPDELPPTTLIFGWRIEVDRDSLFPLSGDSFASGSLVISDGEALIAAHHSGAPNLRSYFTTNGFDRPISRGAAGFSSWRIVRDSSGRNEPIYERPLPPV